MHRKYPKHSSTEVDFPARAVDFWERVNVSDPGCAGFTSSGLIEHQVHAILERHGVISLQKIPKYSPVCDGVRPLQSGWRS